MRTNIVIDDELMNDAMRLTARKPNARRSSLRSNH
ncbi:type II toxin-antitoxin system VapB family antitoxin [Nitrosomonas sp. Nm51]